MDKKAVMDMTIGARVAPRVKRAFIAKAAADGGASTVLRLLVEQYVAGNLKVVPSTIRKEK